MMDYAFAGSRHSGSPHRAGDFMFPEFQMANWAAAGPCLEDVPGWWDDFWQLHKDIERIEIPLPAMFRTMSGKRIPIWKGGLRPANSPEAKEDQMYVADFKLKHHLVKDRCVVEPTIAEYNKYHRPALVTEKYYLRTKGGEWNWSCELIYRPSKEEIERDKAQLRAAREAVREQARLDREAERRAYHKRKKRAKEASRKSGIEPRFEKPPLQVGNWVLVYKNNKAFLAKVTHAPGRSHIIAKRWPDTQLFALTASEYQRIEDPSNALLEYYKT